VLRIADFTLLAARLLLAAVFFLAGATKLVDPLGSRRSLRDFGLPPALARPTVLLLPVAELAVAIALIPTALAWYGARGALALLTVFMIAVGIAMVRGRKPDCHCFGQLHSMPVGRSTLIRNGILAALAAGLVSRGHRQLGPDLWTWFGTLDVHERKVAVVAACAMGFVFFRLLDRSRPETESIESQMTSAVDDEEDAAENRPPDRAAPASRQPAPKRAERPAPVRRTAMGIGLPIGTPAPEFELPGINGAKHSLRSLRKPGKDILLIFSSPFCKPCEALPSNIVRWTREMDGFPDIFLVSRGAAADNLPKLKEFGTSRVLLQPDFEVAEAYDCTATPTAVLVGADGLIRSELAVGGPAIKQLLSSSAKNGNSVQSASIPL
jgi:uncharacterized membrane protein YphA (DoxX/SURF4 family)/peroxiredoxin